MSDVINLIVEKVRQHPWIAGVTFVGVLAATIRYLVGEVLLDGLKNVLFKALGKWLGVTDVSTLATIFSYLIPLGLSGLALWIVYLAGQASGTSGVPEPQGVTLYEIALKEGLLPDTPEKIGLTDSGGGGHSYRPPTAAEQREFQRQARRKLEESTLGAAGETVCVPFPQSNSGVQFSVGSGDRTYSVSISLAGSTAVFVYPGTLKNVAPLEDVKRGDLVDLRGLRPMRGATVLRLAERVMIAANDGAFIQLLLVGVQHYDSGDSCDEARFKYLIHDGIEHLVPAL